MRYPAGHKQQTREKILRAAGKVFRREGYHAAGVDKVMEEAGLTAGGFYSHFDSKDALLAEALAPAAEEVGAARDRHIEQFVGIAGVEAFVKTYLSSSHRNTTEGCPIPALVSEIARTGEPVKQSFETIVRSLASQLKERAGGAISEDRALAIIALCVGGLGLARSVQDKALSDRVLAACIDLLKED